MRFFLNFILFYTNKLTHCTNVQEMFESQTPWWYLPHAGLFQLLYVLNVRGKSKEEEGEPSNQLQKVGIGQKKSRGWAHLIPLVVSKHCVC